MQRSLTQLLFKNRSLYFASAVLATLSLYACNGNKPSPVVTQHNPQPGATPSCPSMSVTIPIVAGSVGKGAAAFGANPMVIPQGAVVTWANQDEYPHTATANSGEWDTGTIMPGESSRPMQFMNPGTVPYHCMVHGAESMSGTLEVTPLPSGCPMPTASPVPGEPEVTPPAEPIVSPSGMPSSR